MISFNKRNYRKALESTEICLTPLIDVALTLLVVFMMTTPPSQNSVKIDLVQGSSQEEHDPQDQDITVSISQDQRIYLNQQHIQFDDIIPVLKECVARLPGPPKVWIKVDKSLNCPAGLLISIIDQIKQAHCVKHIALALQPLNS